MTNNQESRPDKGLLQPPTSTIPPPPPPLPPINKPSPSILKLRTSPPGRFNQTLNIPTRQGPSSTPQAGSYFFYGTLMDPHMLAEILSLEEDIAAVKSQLRPGSIAGYTCKLWGQYPALLAGPSSGSVVRGMVYNVRSDEHAARLAEYETRNYEVMPCRIRYLDGEELGEEVSGWVFVFVGVKGDLGEGVFDLRVWLRRMGRGGGVDGD
ncbi:hypothetical protein AJ80_02595 [Polytolypa hystricis UAMH7299]|uniref:Putative gamma-glutamylcyclotransferase n=1 Tax=Polytolypa hystricis (strain UAMH7299) TaxID=1447883 RepID=A0A2B7YR54_POLH7|nr:hypothetical protein AJ80_02595 [Polytolypa hystricis UAMH7299]